MMMKVDRAFVMKEDVEMCLAKGGTGPFFPKIVYIFCDHHNFFSLSSVQINIISACCLLCVL